MDRTDQPDESVYHAPSPPTGVGLYQRDDAPATTGETPTPRPSPWDDEPAEKPEDPKPAPGGVRSKLAKGRSGGSEGEIQIVGHPFDAELDCGELDDRDRPGPPWTAKAIALSRSSMVFVSRKMCYVDRMLIIAVHLIDCKPAPLFGRVAACEYEGDGRYRVELELQPIPEGRAFVSWLDDRAH